MLIQPMVQADAAGVAFSADPITGDRETAVLMLFAASENGSSPAQASPDDWLVRGLEADVEQLLKAPSTKMPRSGSLNSLGGLRLTKESPRHRVGDRRRGNCAAPGTADHRATGPTN